MHYYDTRFNWPDMFRGIVARNIDLLYRIGPTLLRQGESCIPWIDADGLGARIVVVSSRPDELLRTIKQEIFPTFEFLGTQTTNGKYFWTHFRAM